MAVNLSLSKDEILKKLNNAEGRPSLDEIDTLAYWNMQWLKKNGWHENGIGFYFNNTYKKGRYTYWIDYNTVIPALNRYDNIEHNSVEVGSWDMRRNDPFKHFNDIADLIAWLDTAIGNEEEYCVHVQTLKREIKELPKQIENALNTFNEYSNSKEYGLDYYKMIYGELIVSYVEKLQRYNSNYVMSDEVKRVYDLYKKEKQ